MPLPSVTRAAMLEAIQRFRAGERTSQGPHPGDDWLSKANHRWVIVHDGEPYPLKEIIRLAIRVYTGADAPAFTGGTGNAKPYAEPYELTVVPKAEWRQS